jgi:NADH-quinone oxidoreductase subunit J
MTSATLLFFGTAAISVISAFGVILHPNPVRCALFLVVNFLCLAVLYLLLNAQVLAVLQILVYAGAIMVLFLFVIMLLNLGGELNREEPLEGQRFFTALLALGLLGGLGFGVRATSGLSPAVAQGAIRAEQAEREGILQIQVIGWDLFTKYVYPFELTSVLLLVGVIGVMILTRRRAGQVSTG